MSPRGVTSHSNIFPGLDPVRILIKPPCYGRGIVSPPSIHLNVRAYEAPAFTARHLATSSWQGKFRELAKRNSPTLYLTSWRPDFLSRHSELPADDSASKDPTLARYRLPEPGRAKSKLPIVLESPGRAGDSSRLCKSRTLTFRW